MISLIQTLLFFFLFHSPYSSIRSRSSRNNQATSILFCLIIKLFPKLGRHIDISRKFNIYLKYSTFVNYLFKKKSRRFYICILNNCFIRESFFLYRLKPYIISLQTCLCTNVWLYINFPTTFFLFYSPYSFSIHSRYSSHIFHDLFILRIIYIA